MSTDRQILSSALTGEALLRTRRPEIDALIAELRALAQDRDDVRTEAGATMAGAWFASPATAYAENLIAAGLLLLAGRSTATRSWSGSAWATSGAGSRPPATIPVGRPANSHQ